MNNKKKQSKNFNQLKILLIFLFSIELISALKFNKSLIKSIYLFSLNNPITSSKSLIKSQNCPDLENAIRRIIGQNISSWSVSYITNGGKEIVSINSNIPRIPASNQKLITTAYSLDKLGPNFKLETLLKRDILGNYHLSGTGDPDFGNYHINKIVNRINKGYIFKSILDNSNKTILYLYEEPKFNWWPDDWNHIDKNEIYGAPITRLALNANSSNTSINNPLYSTVDSFKGYTHINSNIILKVKDQRDLNYNIFDRNILSIKSASMGSLLSLANSESHNFTAEVLLRNALGNWDTSINKVKLTDWLISQNIPIKNFYISDGSGLSRSNRVTSRGISHLLYKMKSNKYWKHYLSSMSIIGIRGTLSEFPASGILKTNFFGKSGTLTGVRSLSGYIRKTKNFSVVSILTENIDNPDPIISKVLSNIYSQKYCLQK